MGVSDSGVAATRVQLHLQRFPPPFSSIYRFQRSSASAIQIHSVAALHQAYPLFNLGFAL